jgi:hypothetical protein
MPTNLLGVAPATVSLSSATKYDEIFGIAEN